MSLQSKLLIKQTGQLLPQQLLEQKILQLNTPAMEQYIQKIVEENPALEIDEADSLSSEEYEQYNTTESQKYEQELQPEFTLNDEGEYEETLPYKEYTPETGYIEAISNEINKSIYEQINAKVAQLRLSKIEKKIAEQIVGNLDQYGFLKSTPQEIADYFLLYLNQSIAIASIIKVLTIIQNLEPIGIASRNIQEFLTIQIKQKLKTTPDSRILKIGLDIVEKYLDFFSSKNYEMLAKKMQLDVNTLSSVTSMIETLTPYPCDWNTEQFAHNTKSIVADFSVFFRDNMIETHINNKYVPKIRINKKFVDIYKSTASNIPQQTKKAKAFLHKDIQQAEFIIQAIKMRYQTLQNIIRYIGEKQTDYFRTGDDTKLQPMLLKDIAIHTKRDISTISRALSNKYIETDWGLKKTKFFINTAITDNQSGKITTLHQVTKVLQELVNNENKKTPLTDEELTDMMSAKGFSFSRKTIVSYRKKLKIPSSKFRRKI